MKAICPSVWPLAGHSFDRKETSGVEILIESREKKIVLRQVEKSCTNPVAYYFFVTFFPFSVFVIVGAQLVFQMSCIGLNQ